MKLTKQGVRDLGRNPNWLRVRQQHVCQFVEREEMRVQHDEYSAWLALVTIKVCLGCGEEKEI